MADIAAPMAEWRRTLCRPAGVPSVQGWRSGSYSDDFSLDMDILGPTQGQVNAAQDESEQPIPPYYLSP